MGISLNDFEYYLNNELKIKECKAVEVGCYYYGPLIEQKFKIYYYVCNFLLNTTVTRDKLEKFLHKRRLLTEKNLKTC